MTNIQMLSNEQICRDVLKWEPAPSITRRQGKIHIFAWIVNGERIDTPDFDNDMNAWFKWVVPYLQEKYEVDYVGFNLMYRLGSKEEKLPDLRVYMCSIQKIVDEGARVEVLAEIIDKSPALAFKKAFTELVNNRGEV